MRAPDQPPAVDRSAIGIGLAASAMGAFVVLMGVGVLPRKAGDAPGWVGVVAGLIFVLGGLAVLVRGFYRSAGDIDGELPAGAPYWLRWFYYLLGLAVTASLAVIASWVAFVPGKRAFTATLPFAGDMPANEMIGRAAFGLGALMTWLILIALAVAGARRLRGHRG